MSNLLIDEIGETTPAQFYEVRRNLHARITAERKLLFAALEDGVRCFLGQVSDTGRSKERVRAQRLAQEWILDDSPETPFGFTFVHLCEEFEICASALRAGLMRARSAQLKLPSAKMISKGIKNDLILAPGQRGAAAA